DTQGPTGGRIQRGPFGPAVDLDQLDPDAALGERAHVLVLDALSLLDGEPIEARRVGDDDVLVARARELHLPHLAHRGPVWPELVARPGAKGSDAQAGGAAELQHQLKLLRIAERVVLGAVGQALREVADLTL